MMNEIIGGFERRGWKGHVGGGVRERGEEVVRGKWTNSEPWELEPLDLPDGMYRISAMMWPTLRERREVLAAGMADTILQIVRRDAVYRGLGDQREYTIGVEGLGTGRGGRGRARLPRSGPVASRETAATWSDERRERHAAAMRAWWAKKKEARP